MVENCRLATDSNDAPDSMDIACIGSGENTIVAIHGIQGTRASWQALADGLQSNVRWVLPNLRGRAAALRGEGRDDYTLEKFASDVVDVIKWHVHTPHYVLAGWSMGVSVALATIELLRKCEVPMPSALILMSGTPSLNETQWFHATETSALIKEIEEREQRLNLRQAADRDAVAWTWQSISGTDQRGLLAGIDIPTLIVHGDLDEDSPYQHAHIFRQELPNASLQTIEGGRHSILSQNTPQVATAIRAFLSNFENKNR